MQCTRDDLVEAAKVPAIMGRGEVYGLVIGVQRLHSLATWARNNNEPELDIFGSCPVGKLMGFEALIVTQYPNTLFAVTRDEYAAVANSLEREG
jgi:hypothetical protein